MKAIHLSDIHIGKSDNTAKFASIVNWIVDKKSVHKAEIVVITGDIVDDGSLGQYREAQKQIGKLSASGFLVLCVPGNHDYGAQGIVESRECMTRFRTYISGSIDYPSRVDIPGSKHTFVLLDSMFEEMNGRELWGAQGELGKQQLAELDRILNEIESSEPDRTVVLALHHHPFYYNYFLKLRDDALFKKVITDEDRGDSRVDCVLFGHKHSEKRFPDKEQKYNTKLIYASGSSTERQDDGKMKVPVIDLDSFQIADHRVA